MGKELNCLQSSEIVSQGEPNSLSLFSSENRTLNAARGSIYCSKRKDPLSGKV
jgi:hypothetical protein